MKINIYETPAVEVLEVYTEGLFCVSSNDSESDTDAGYGDYIPLV